jgi:hypothetical protein
MCPELWFLLFSDLRGTGGKQNDRVRAIHHTEWASAQNHCGNDCIYLGAIFSLVSQLAWGRAGLAAWKTDEEQLAQTTFGKLLLLHLHPANVIVQAIGFGILLCSAWIHSGMYIALGVSMILLGHMWGWHKVNASL